MSVKQCDGRNLVIDFHTHWLPYSWPDLSRRYGYQGFLSVDHEQEFVSNPGNARLLLDSELYLEIGPNCWDMSKRIVDMDSAGVDIQVISTIPEMFVYWAKEDDAADLSRILNNSMAEQVRLHPERFIPLGTLPLQAPELALAEMKRCVEELGFKGFIIGTHVNDWNLDSAELVPFWESAEQLDVCIFVHPNDLQIKGQFRKLPNFLPKLVGMPAEMCHAVSCLLTGGIFEKFPKLKVCFANGAGTFPYVREQLQQAFMNAKVNELDTETSPPNLTNPKVFCDSLVSGDQASKFLFETMNPSNVLFGSDYPAPLGQITFEAVPKYINHIESLFPEIESSQRDDVIGRNAYQLLNLDRR